MPALVLRIEMDSAAFEIEPGYELARILRVIARDVSDRGHDHDGAGAGIRDVNGNRVGVWEIGNASTPYVEDKETEEGDHNS